MKHIYIILSAALMALTMSSCHEEYTTYKGPEYVMFADTLSTSAIEQNNEAFAVKVASTVICR